MNAEICLPRIWLLHQLQQLRWYARLVRLAPCLVIFALALEGYCLAIRRLEWPSGAALATAGAAACALAFANALNDLVDIAIDRVNYPARPLVSGPIHARAAGRLVALLAVASLACALAAGTRMFWLTLLALLGAAVYSLWASRVALLGNLIVALLYSCAIIAGYCVAPGGTLPAIPFAGSFMFMLGREFVGTISDAAGDRLGGRVSVCMLWGQRRVLGAGLVLALLASATLLSAGWFGSLAYARLYCASMVCSSVLPLLYAVAALWRDARIENIRAVGLRLRIIFVLNLGSFLLLIPARA